MTAAPAFSLQYFLASQIVHQLSPMDPRFVDTSKISLSSLKLGAGPALGAGLLTSSLTTPNPVRQSLTFIPGHRARRRSPDLVAHDRVANRQSPALGAGLLTSSLTRHHRGGHCTHPVRFDLRRSSGRTGPNDGQLAGRQPHVGGFLRCRRSLHRWHLATDLQRS